MSRRFRPGPRSAAGFALIAAAFALRGAAARDAVPMAAPCGCLADFDELTRMVEQNYIGFALEVTGGRRAEYERLRTELRVEAERAGDGSCVFVLRRLTDWFGDGHLFVIEAPPADSARSARLAAARERVALGEPEARAYLDANAGRLDPIEGIWYDRGLRVAIVRREGVDREFVGVVLASGDERWEPGMVKAEFRRSVDGYEAILFAADHSPRHPPETRLGRRGALLHLTPDLWGKAWPVTTVEQRRLDPENPRSPTFHRPGDGVVLFSVPSHDPEIARGRLEQLAAAHESEILAARLLVIDVRDDEGGSSLATRPLAPFYSARGEPRPPRVPDGGPSALLASADHIAEAEANVRDNPHLPPAMLAVVDEMRSRPGEVVRLPEGLFETGPFVPPTVHDSPPRVAILIDPGVMSAGEAFALEAARSDRVTLFGQNTAGVIDYQNVRVRPLACAERGLRLGYPEFAAGRVLEGHRINGSGVAPDVRIGDDVEDWVGFVSEYYRARG